MISLTYATISKHNGPKANAIVLLLQWHPPDEELERKGDVLKLKSVTQQNDLAELAMHADLADTSFAAEKQNVVILSSSAFTGLDPLLINQTDRC
jgi:hypothetical protein